MNPKTIHAITFIILSYFLVSCNETKILKNSYFKKEKKIALVEKSFSTTDGYTISYCDNEALNKPVLFFVHQYSMDRRSLFKLAEKFRKKYRLILVDLPGFGKSSKNPSGDYRVTSQAKRLNELIKELNLKEVNLIGVTMGGAINIVLNTLNTNIKTSTLIAPLGMPLYPYEFPEIIKRFVETGQISFLVEEPYNEKRTRELISLSSNIPEFLIPKTILKGLKVSLIKDREVINKVGKDILYDKFSFISMLKENEEYKKFDKITSDFGISLESFVKNVDNIAPVLNLVNKNKNIERIDAFGNSYEVLSTYLEKIENPVLVIWGKKDNIIHYKTMESMMPYIRKGTFKLIKNGSHFVTIQKRNKVYKEIKEFIGRY
jgi:pimeloyl-ACP methyl ester carboxylesterase